MRKSLKIAVFLGGTSAEREVSLRTGKAVARALASVGHSVYEIDPRPGSWTLEPGTDAVFNARELRGRNACRNQTLLRKNFVESDPTGV